jgi:hypothetical protein
MEDRRKANSTNAWHNTAVFELLAAFLTLKICVHLLATCAAAAACCLARSVCIPQVRLPLASPAVPAGDPQPHGNTHEQASEAALRPAGAQH